MAGIAKWQNGAEWQKEWQNGRMAGMDTYVLGGNGGEWRNSRRNGGIEWQTECSNGGNGGNGGTAERMAECGMAEWREWRYGGKNGRIAEWQKLLHTYYLRYTHTHRR